MIASIRLLLQMKIHRRLYVDDYFLIFACVCLTAATILCCASIGHLYFSQDLDFNPTHIYYLLAEHVDIASAIDAYIRLFQIYPSLQWATIFGVKCAYLAFFRRLIDRIRPLVIYWRVVTAITIVSFPVCIVSIFVVCTKTGLEAGQCIHNYISTELTWSLELVKCTSPFYFHLSLGMAAFSVILDVGTDLLLVGIPIRLLCFVRIKPRQKLIVGVFLSLNLFMVITAVIRVSGVSFRGRFDDVWLFVWSQTEACVAVSMISVTAFRSAFVDLESSRARIRREEIKKPWYSSTISAIKRNKAQRLSDAEATPGELPKVPSATLTGIRTFIQGPRQTTGATATVEGEPAEWPLHNGCHDSN